MEGLRRSAWLVVAAALAPLLLFFAFQSAFTARDQRRSIEDRALAKSEAVSLAADGEVKQIAAGLDALATARSLRAGNMDEFRSRAIELSSLYPGWRGVELVDRATGRSMLRVGDAGPSIQPSGSPPFRNQLRLAGYARTPACMCIVFERPTAGRSPMTLRLFVNSGRFLALLPPARGRYEVSAIAGPMGRFIARSIDPDSRFGTLGSQYLRAAARSGRQQGIYRGFTLEGFQNYTAYTRSPLTGWTTHVALGSGFIDNPARRFLASLGVAAALSLLLAAVLIWFALRQVAEGRRIAERMQQSQKLEALGQLTGGLAHDFNNLLTPVVGALHFLAGKPELDARAKRIAAGALTSAERAGKLTAQLLAFSRRQKLDITPIDVAAMLDEMRDMFRQSVGEAHSVEVDQPDEQLCVLGDLNQLELAILNLLLNARDASPEGGTIEIAISGEGTPDDGIVRIAVRDQGTGMDENTRRRAFEPFFTTKSHGSGTGLGLAQVFGMAEQSGGNVEIDSEAGAGTTVMITLRRCHPSERQAAIFRAPSDGKDQAPLRLLVVDDEPEVRLTIVRPLEEAGHVVDAVSDGPTALAAIEQRRFDLVVVDFAMPGMDGAELIRRARLIRRDVRFLMITGYSDSEATASASADTPILKKPFAGDALVAAVHSQVE